MSDIAEFHNKTARIFTYVCGLLLIANFIYGQLFSDTPIKESSGDLGSLSEIGVCKNNSYYDTCDVKIDNSEKIYVRAIHDGALIQLGDPVTYKETISEANYRYYICFNGHLCEETRSVSRWTSDYKMHYARMISQH